MIHGIKAWPQYFQAMWDGLKTFEFRVNDRGYQVGDCLMIDEWNPYTREYTRRWIRAEVTHMLRGPDFGLAADHVIMSIRVDAKE